MLKKIRNPLLFAGAMIPLAAIGGIFTSMYMFSIYEPTMQQEILAAAGGQGAFLASSALQSVVVAVICGFLGYILSEKIGLMKSFKFEKKSLIPASVTTVICGIFFALDYWVFGGRIPGLAETYSSQTSPASFLSAIFYGGFVEEVLMRLFLMSLIAFILWKVFARKQDKEHIPQIIFMAANILLALLFSAGHLPATVGIFGTLTPIIVLRCFLINGGLGAAFGWLYYKYGIQYAMLAHAGCHIVSKVIWILFI